MTGILVAAVVVLAGLYLVGLGVVSLFAPDRAERFLLGFAGSASVHYLELVIRLIVGGALLLQSERMLVPTVFRAFGWILVITTVGLFAVPWRLHHRFAQQSVPHALKYLGLLGAVSLAFGGFILISVAFGHT